MNPDLIIQMQRLGDLVLTFPLLRQLGAHADEQTAVRVVAEPSFYEALLPIAPRALFLPPDAPYELRERAYDRVINLSHRPASADLAQSLRARAWYGLRKTAGVYRIDGDWQLYRAGLVHNNRHNLLHWADLHGLDLLEPGAFAATKWPKINKTGQQGRIGLFVGASQAEKRPEPEFWAALARILSKRGLKPVFLGGKAERALAAKAAKLAGLPGSNLSARFSLEELAQFMRRLDLLVTPDTGPMHVAAWAGVWCLNLSMGPVNAWETAPAPPGHLVLRSTIECSGCWRCEHEQPLCKHSFEPARVAALVGHLLGLSTQLPRLPGLELLRTGRNQLGLFELEPLTPLASPGRYYLADFWRQWFLRLLGGPPGDPDAALTRLATHDPALVAALREAALAHQVGLAQSLRHCPLDQDAWQSYSPLVRLWSNFVQLRLENADYSPQARQWAVHNTEQLRELLTSYCCSAT